MGSVGGASVRDLFLTSSLETGFLAAAHDAYRKAIRAGENLRRSSPDEVMRHGGPPPLKARVSGRQSAARQMRRYQEDGTRRVRAVYYKPKDVP